MNSRNKQNNKKNKTALSVGLFLCLSVLFSVGCQYLKRESYQVEPTPNAPTYQSAMSAFKNLDLEGTKTFELSEDETKFRAGLEMILNQNLDSAVSIFFSIYESCTNDSIKRETVNIIYNLLFYQSKWEQLLEFDIEALGESEDEDNIMLLARALSIVPKEEINFGSSESVVDWTPSPTGCPIIPCYINGNLRYFWFDTGANYSVIATDIANECNVLPIVFEQSKARTSTIRKVFIYPAISDSLRIGEMTIKNSPFVIVDEEDLKLRLFGSHGKTKIDGIIGWKAIQHMDVSINNQSKTMIIRKPIKTNIPLADKNLFWLGCPIIKLFDTNRTSVIFGLDIGSEKSSITHNIFNKIEFHRIYQKVKPITSAGGSVYFHANLISRLHLILDEYSIEFYDIGTTYQVPHLFLSLDGILGCDFMENSLIRIDILNGIFSFQPFLE